MHQCHWFCLLYTRDHKNLNKVRLQNSRGFFLKISKQTVKCGVRVLRARSKRASHVHRACEAREKKKRLSPVSLSLFSLFPDLLFDCSSVLEYAEIRTVLQSKTKSTLSAGSLCTIALLCCLSLLRFIETAKKNQQYVGPLKWESGQK